MRRKLSFAMPTHTNLTRPSWFTTLRRVGDSRKMYKPGYRYMKCGVMLTDLVQGRQSPRRSIPDTRDEEAAIEPHGRHGRNQRPNGKADALLRGTGVARAWTGIASSQVSRVHHRLE